MDDEWQLRWVRVPEGTHLSNSRETRGASRDLLREDGTNRNLGPTESVPADGEFSGRARSELPESPDDSTELGLTRGQEFVLGVIAEVVQAVDWEAVFEQIVAPAVKRRMTKIRGRFRSAGRRLSEPASPGTEVEHLASTPIASEAIVHSSVSATVPMSGAEFRERAMSVLAAEAYAARQKEILSNARIVDGSLPEELASAMQLLLEGRVDSLNERQLEAVMEFLNRSTEGEELLAIGDGEREVPPDALDA